MFFLFTFLILVSVSLLISLILFLNIYLIQKLGIIEPRNIAWPTIFIILNYLAIPIYLLINAHSIYIAIAINHFTRKHFLLYLSFPIILCFLSYGLYQFLQHQHIRKPLHLLCLFAIPMLLHCKTLLMLMP